MVLLHWSGLIRIAFEEQFQKPSGRIWIILWSQLKVLPAYPLLLGQLRWDYNSLNSEASCAVHTTLTSPASVSSPHLDFLFFTIINLNWARPFSPFPWFLHVVRHGAAEDEVQPAEAGASGPGPLAAVLAGSDLRRLHLLSGGLPQDRAAP